MTTLTETQIIILNAGAQRPDNIAMPLPVTTRLAPPAGFRRKALRHVHSDVVCDVSYARRGDAGRSSWY